MKVQFEGNSNLQVLFFSKSSKQIPNYLKKQKLFNGEESEIIVLPEENKTLIYCGIGEKDNKNYFNFLKTGVNLSKKLKTIHSANALIDFENLNDFQGFFITEGLFLDFFYRYSLKKDAKNPEISELILKNMNENLADKALIIANSRNLVRKLTDMPANLLTTTVFVEKIKEALTNIPCKMTVWDNQKLLKEDMAGLLAVGGGSANPPYLVQVQYKPEIVNKKVILVGKGITFDSGGLSIKPTEGMIEMKTDMAGAATVLGLIEAIYALSLPIEIHAFMPIAENMLSGTSYRIGDILKYRNGKTVEISNTDAEGRLILADALCLTEKLDSDLIIDLATLTGACMVALGTDIYGVFSNDEKMAKNFCDYVNSNSSDRAWVLPLYEKYKDSLKSSIADFKNSGKRFGGAISAALFLKEFVPNNSKWMHLDIAGPSYDDGIGLFDGFATGIPLESVLLYLEDIIS